MPLLNIGKQGIEKSFNEILIGKAGNKEVEVNSSGKIIREISKQSSIQGQDINLTVNSKLQKFSMSKLSQYKAGSIVVIDVNSGDILSMTSSPNYNSNLIIKKPNKDYWDSLLENLLGL